MTDQVEEIKETALQGVDGFFTKLTEAADIVTAKLIAVAPEAAEAILELVQFKGIFGLAAGAVITSIFLYIGLTIVSKTKNFKITPKTYDTGEAAAGTFLVKYFGYLFFVAAFYSFKVNIVDFYSWLSAFYPEGAIALKALEAVGVNL